MSRRAEPILAAALMLALTGCGGGTAEPDPPGNAAPPTVATAPGTQPTVASRADADAGADADGGAGAGAMPDAITVSTNEPFYSAVVAGDVVTLTGVDMPERRMRVVGREAGARTRGWRARDDGGELIVRVVRTPCADDMSGAPRDYAATLIVDGRTARGCGYTGNRPPPPPETDAATVLPARFTGRWNIDRAACSRPAASIDGVRITPAELWFHESAGVVKTVEPIAPDRIRITAAYEGEGERWTATQILAIDGDRLTIDTAGQVLTRVRCPG